MREIKKMPPQSVVMDWLHYSPSTGVFTWMKEPAIMSRNKLTEAGTKRKTGYVFISFGEYGLLAAHRLAWAYVRGNIPEGMEVDHIDGDPSNNRIDNLRLATSSQQKMNKRVQSNNRSGLKGAYYHAAHKGKKWRSQIRVNGRCRFLGYYHTPEEAHAAYAEAAKEFFGEFARVA